MKRLACLFALVACVAQQPACAAEWRMDPANSRLEFAASFEKTPAPGVFKEFDTQLNFDPEKPAGGRLDVTIRVASADMTSADINKAIAGAEWFDFARHQQAEFHSTDIRQINAQAGNYLARGVLTLKGVQQTVEVPFKWSEAPDGATMQGEFIVKRTPFGIGTGEWTATDVIGPEVAVKFRVRLRKAA
ncbi:YceI family protein [Variovorax sp. J2P1-59]|uniref:YceI family protein n=1 Tax=Variovorax flavidus TaxID=3053501 RepID=UPI002575DB7D|nr:YceI family protein [Variovorax sp. J2P1-59]MDM0074058.1 YceI family protein [Variovorax sp. J2P1-59]